MSSPEPLAESDFLRLFVKNEEALRAFARVLLPTWESLDEVLQEASVAFDGHGFLPGVPRIGRGPRRKRGFARAFPTSMQCECRTSRDRQETHGRSRWAAGLRGASSETQLLQNALVFLIGVALGCRSMCSTAGRGLDVASVSSGFCFVV